MSVHIEGSTLPSDAQQSITTLSKKLIIAWICGLFWDIGPFLAWGVFLSWAFSGLASFSGHGPMTFIQVIAIILGLLVGALSPMVLSYFLLRNWKLAFRNGLLAAGIGWAGSWIGWIVGGAFGNWVHSISLLDPHRVVLKQMGVGFDILLSPTLSALTAAVVVAFTSIQTTPRRFLGVSAGLVIGLAFIVLSWFVIQGATSSQFVWVNVIFSTELVAGRIKWKDFIVWLSLMLAAFGLLFLTLQLFPSQ